MHVNFRILPQQFLYVSIHGRFILEPSCQKLPGQVLCHVDAGNSEGIVDAITLGLAMNRRQT